MSIHALRGMDMSFQAMMHKIMEDHPDATGGIITVFCGDDENMHTYYKANDQQIALTSVRLSHLANKDK